MAISQKIEKRTLSFAVIVILIFIVLILRLAYLQLIKGDKFFSMAENNRIEYQTIGAPRGKIYTTDGEILVTNKLAYSASIRSNALHTEESVTKITNELSRILDLDRQELLESLLRNVVDGKVILLNDLTSADKETLTANLENMPGTSIEQMVDENGQIIKEYFQINIQRVSMQNLLKTSKKFSELFPIEYDQLLVKLIANGDKNSKVPSIRVKRNLTQEEMVILEENLNDLPGVTVDKLSIRDYVNGLTLAHTLGYMGSISIDELQYFSDQGYRGDDLIGKTGLERYYESYLRGEDGREQIEVNSKREKMRTLGVNEPLPGANLFINIDLGLQKKVEQLLDETLTQLREEAKDDPKLKGGPTGGAVVVMNPQNGKILTLVSNPAFDPNLFAEGISNIDFNSLQNDPYKPFTNRVIGVAPPPGSIFKLVSAATYLEEKFIDENTIVNDVNGRYTIGEWTFDNWARTSRGGIGELNIRGAIANSNNIFFYTIAHQIYNQGRGGEVLPEYAKKFGLGQLTGIDLTGEKEGLVPDKEYKREKYGEIWLPGNSLHLSIGQWDLSTTPIQLLRYVSAIGNGGTLYRPAIVDRIENYDGMLIKKFEPEVVGHLPVSPKNLEILKDGMVGVTTVGTAQKSFEDLPIKVAGKTGTAQTTSSYANHGWFAGFAPAEKPEIAILVFIEQGVSSSNTLPIVREILKYYFDIEDPVPEVSETPENELSDEQLAEDEVGMINEPEPTLSEKLKKFFDETFSTP